MQFIHIMEDLQGLIYPELPREIENEIEKCSRAPVNACQALRTISTTKKHEEARRAPHPDSRVLKNSSGCACVFCRSHSRIWAPESVRQNLCVGLASHRPFQFLAQVQAHQEPPRMPLGSQAPPQVNTHAPFALLERWHLTAAPQPCSVHYFGLKPRGRSLT